MPSESSDPVVYVTRAIPQAGLDLLGESCEVHVWEGTLPPGHDHIVERVRDLQADGLLCLLSDRIDGDLLDASPSLRVVSTYSVGYDHIDIDAADRRDIAVGHTPGVLTETTADFAWALLLATARRVVEGQAFVASGEWEAWDPRRLPGTDVHGGTLGIVGMGGIGTAVARRAAGFDVDVCYTSRTPKPDVEDDLAGYGLVPTYLDLPDLLERVDFLSLHVPLTEETHHLIGDAELDRLPSDAVVVNTSRGEVIDTDALDRALATDSIGRAGLDVTDPEPLPADHPIMRHSPEKLVVAPHIGSASTATRDEMARMAARNVLAGLRGESLPHAALA